MKNYKKDFKYICESNKKFRSVDNKEAITILLKEFLRRMFFLKNKIELEGVKTKNPLFFDITYLINGSRISFEEIMFDNMNVNESTFSFIDKLIISSYLNWKYNLSITTKNKYGSINPYEPVIEIYKKGGHNLNKQYGRIEVYPFIGVLIHPKEDYEIDTPFWDGDTKKNTLLEE